ncbi:M16 family metallopeptidase [Marinicrinis lubricantis]|uniref:M16 family metallopeptidase n=1 Tax=Marinicrinis lubricantis TaxID=2086470 RepID=A0ABW1IMA1_9BACL
MKHHTLSNGMRVVIETIPTCRSVSFGIWVKTGSRSETKENNGISHFIEHMLFKGTDRYSAKDIADYFDGIGGMINAFTAKEYTCYYTKVLDEHLPGALEYLASMYFDSVFDEEDMEKEKNVVLEEISMYEDTPDDQVHDLLAEACYGDHSLGYSILGTESNLASFKPDDLRRYMKEYYTVDHTVISLAGNVDERIIPLLEQHFSRSNNHSTAIAYEAPVFTPKSLFIKKATEQNHICLSFPGRSLQDPHLYSMILLNNNIGGGMSSRLFQEIREKRGLAYSVYSYHSSHADSGLFTIYIGTAPKQTEEVLKVTMSILEEIQAKGLTEEELHRGKEQMKGSLILSLESNSSRMNRNGKNELMLGRHDTLDEMVRRIEAVQMEDIRQMIQQVIAQPFASAMVGNSDEALNRMRRDAE